MAEVAATIIAIVTFGAQITSQLYDVGAYINGIQADTDRVANNVSLYSDVLELLADRFKSDPPIHSSKALRLANKICTQSGTIFEDIHCRLPKTNAPAPNSFSWIEKVKWYFRRKHVNALVAQLECLKSTASLLLNVLSMEKLSGQEEAGDEDDDPRVDIKLITEGVERRLLDASPSQRSEMALVVREETRTLMNVSRLLDKEDTATGKRQLVISRIDSILRTLLDEWTRLDLNGNEYAEIVKGCVTVYSKRRSVPFLSSAMGAISPPEDQLKTERRDANLSATPRSLDTTNKESPVSILDDKFLTMGLNVSGTLDNQIFEIVSNLDSNPETKYRIRGVWQPKADLLLRRLQESIRSTTQVLRNRYENGIRNGLSFEPLETLPHGLTGHNTTDSSDHEHTDDADTPFKNATAGRNNSSTEPEHRPRSDDMDNIKLDDRIPVREYISGKSVNPQRKDGTRDSGTWGQTFKSISSTNERKSEEVGEPGNNDPRGLGGTTKEKAAMSTAKDATDDPVSAPRQKNRVITCYTWITETERRDGVIKKCPRTVHLLDPRTGTLIEKFTTVELHIRTGSELGSKFRSVCPDLRNGVEAASYYVEWHYVVDTSSPTLHEWSNEFLQTLQPQVSSFVRGLSIDQRNKNEYDRLRGILRYYGLEISSMRYKTYFEPDIENIGLIDELSLLTKEDLVALDEIDLQKNRKAFWC